MFNGIDDSISPGTADLVIKNVIKFVFQLI